MVATETLRPAMPEMFTIRPFRESLWTPNYDQFLYSNHDVSYHPDLFFSISLKKQPANTVPCFILRLRFISQEIRAVMKAVSTLQGTAPVRAHDHGEQVGNPGNTRVYTGFLPQVCPDHAGTLTQRSPAGLCGLQGGPRIHSSTYELSAGLKNTSRTPAPHLPRHLGFTCQQKHQVPIPVEMKYVWLPGA